MRNITKVLLSFAIILASFQLSAQNTVAVKAETDTVAVEAETDTILSEENDTTSLSSFSKEFQELLALLKDSVHGTKGNVYLPECNATIHVPQGYMYLDKKQTQHLMSDIWDNLPDDDILGSLAIDTANIFIEIQTAFIIYFDNCGYVKDDDANSIDYDDMLEDMKKSAKEDSKTRIENGLDGYELVGWAERPYYDKDLKVLHWAKQLKFNNDSSDVLNYDIRVLGKNGYMILQAISDMEELPNIKAISNQLVSSVEFDNGYTYNDFDPTKDKIAEWTIGGLIAGNILAKAGLFTKLGLLLAKFWKVILVAIVAIGAFFKKIFGKKEEDDVMFEETKEEATKEEGKE